LYSWNHIFHYIYKKKLSIFIVKVPFFEHKIQEFCFCYLLNIESTYNQFKCENLTNSNYDNSYGDDHFSHVGIFIVMIPFLETWFKDFNFIIYQIQNLHGINLNVDIWIIKIMINSYGGGHFSHAYVIIH